MLQSLIRLGAKYQIEEFSEEAIHYLSPFFPSTMAAWDEIENRKPLVHELADLISMVNLTKQHNLARFYPLAIYRCCQLAPEQPVNGIPHPRGYVARLTSDNLPLYLQSQSTLRQFTMIRVVYTLLGLRVNGWKPCTKCDLYWKRLRNALHASTWMTGTEALMSSELQPDKANATTSLFHDVPVTMCDSCAYRLSIMAEGRREQYFDIIRRPVDWQPLGDNDPYPAPPAPVIVVDAPVAQAPILIASVHAPQVIVLQSSHEFRSDEQLNSTKGQVSIKRQR